MSRRKKILKKIDSNKPALVVFSLILCLLLIVGSTYSWITSSDERINRSKEDKKELSATIDETFTPDFKWAPKTTTTKEVVVRNNGQIPAIVRVSLYEFIALFAVDTSDGVKAGNGGSTLLQEHSTKGSIEMDKLNTWEKGRTYKISDGNYFVVSDVYTSDVNKKDSTKAYAYNGNVNARNSLVQPITINFNDPIYNNTKPAATITDYWYYEAGYFYYSEVLQPKEKTKVLVNSVSLDGKLENKYKNAFYQLIPVMDAHDITKSLLSDWGIQSNSVLEGIYNGKIH